MFYHDATGQLYLHLPVVPTLVVLLILLILIKIKLLSLGLYHKKEDHSEVSQDADLETFAGNRFPYEPKLHSNSQVRRIDL